MLTPDCRVIDTENRYCTDSSTFQRIPNGNLNVPSVMTGEKATYHIKSKGILAKANDAPFFNPIGGLCDVNWTKILFYWFFGIVLACIYR